MGCGIFSPVGCQDPKAHSTCSSQNPHVSFQTKLQKCLVKCQPTETVRVFCLNQMPEKSMWCNSIKVVYSTPGPQPQQGKQITEASASVCLLQATACLLSLFSLHSFTFIAGNLEGILFNSLHVSAGWSQIWQMVMPALLQ